MQSSCNKLIPNAAPIGMVWFGYIQAELHIYLYESRQSCLAFTWGRSGCNKLIPYAAPAPLCKQWQERGHAKSKRLKYSYWSRNPPDHCIEILILKPQPPWSLLALIDCLLAACGTGGRCWRQNLNLYQVWALFFFHLTNWHLVCMWFSWWSICTAQYA